MRLRLRKMNKNLWELGEKVIVRFNSSAYGGAYNNKEFIVVAVTPKGKDNLYTVIVSLETNSNTLHFYEKELKRVGKSNILGNRLAIDYGILEP